MTDKSTLTHNARGEFDLFKVVVGIMTAVVTAGILFICAFVVSTQVGIAELNKDVAALRLWTVRYEADADAAAANLFTKKDAEQAIALRNARLDRMEDVDAAQSVALQALTARVTAIEQKE